MSIKQEKAAFDRCAANFHKAVKQAGAGRKLMIQMLGNKGILGGIGRGIGGLADMAGNSTSGRDAIVRLNRLSSKVTDGGPHDILRQMFKERAKTLKTDAANISGPLASGGLMGAAGGAAGGAVGAAKDIYSYANQKQSDAILGALIGAINRARINEANPSPNNPSIGRGALTGAATGLGANVGALGGAGAGLLGGGILGAALNGETGANVGALGGAALGAGLGAYGGGRAAYNYSRYRSPEEAAKKPKKEKETKESAFALLGKLTAKKSCAGL